MRRKRGLDIHGVVLLDKPVGISSNRALQKVRGIFGARKGGHTGSLDPFATGMLPVCLGEASKTAGFMLEANKRYRGVARLGEATTTGDIEGQLIQHCPVPDCDIEQLSEVVQKFVGKIEQVPPMYSALKHLGKPLYEYARAGIEIERSARLVSIHQLDLLDWQSPVLTFDVHCSKGTYIRTLAEDMATAMGSCAHLISLRRVFVQPFESRPMVTLQQLQSAKEQDTLGDYLLAVDIGLEEWPRFDLTENQQNRFIHGNHFRVSVDKIKAGNLRVYGPESKLLGLASLSAEGVLQPKKVFRL